MSQLHHVPAARFEFAPRVAIWLVGLLVAAAIAVSVVLIANNGDDSTTAPAVSPTSQSIGGPNETLRGQSAANAVGAQSSVSGPDESLRGRAAASAVGSQGSSAGPNETLRGQAAAGATR